MKKLFLLFLIFSSSNVFANWKIEFVSSLGTLTPDVRDSFMSLLWGVDSICIILSFYFALTASRSLSNDDYISGLQSFLGSIVSGVAPAIAKVFIY